MWMPTSAVARGCIGNTALGALSPDRDPVWAYARGRDVGMQGLPGLHRCLFSRIPFFKGGEMRPRQPDIFLVHELEKGIKLEPCIIPWGEFLK